MNIFNIILKFYTEFYTQFYVQFYTQFYTKTIFIQNVQFYLLTQVNTLLFCKN